MLSNGKWEALSEKLRTAGWWEDRTTPRLLERQYHSGKAVLRETKEKVGDRTIFAFGAYWSTKRGKPYEAHLWFRNVDEMKEHFVEMLDELIEKIPVRTKLVVESIVIESREATHHASGYIGYNFGGRE